MKLIKHLVIFTLLTLITQVGGLVYLSSVFFAKKVNFNYKKSIIFIALYLITNLLIIPNLAPFFGRERIKENSFIKAHTFFTKICNRNYVKPQLNKTLQVIAYGLNTNYPETQLVFLDANFPFIDKFPLLPHLSHNDGKKIDLSFIYKNKQGKTTNKKPSISGYGVFITPKKGEYNQTIACKNKGYWQYDYSKHLTFGSINKEIMLDEKATKILIEIILKQNNLSKLFIEPHLKTRMQLKHPKIRFHGCGAVRHDDHIHLQIK